jgi:hypothetical protein
LATLRLATGTPSFVEASFSSSARAATAAARMRWPVDDIEFEPPMPPVWPTTQPSFSVFSCMPLLSVDVPLIIWLISTSSSSAATMRKPVEMPLPGSPWLVRTLIVLSSLMRSHESSLVSDGL